MRKRVFKVFSKPSLTKQAFKDECDVNLIMKKYRNTGVLSHVNERKPRYGDVSTLMDFRSSLDQVNESRALFGALPAKVRSRFRNDPAEFLDFAADPANGEELVRLGLATRREPPRTAAGAAESPVSGSKSG